MEEVLNMLQSIYWICVYGLDVGVMIFKAVQLAVKGPAIILNQKYIWGMFNMNFVAFNFSIEENIFI